MSPVKKLTPAICKEIEEKISTAVAPIAAEYGIRFDLCNSRLFPDATIFTSYCQFAVPEREKTVASEKEEEDYLCYAESFGMRAEWLGKSFKRGNFDYKVVGLRVDAPTECAILERSDGARSYENGKLISRFMN